MNLPWRRARVHGMKTLFLLLLRTAVVVAALVAGCAEFARLQRWRLHDWLLRLH
jgi:hypothetical protein